MDSFYDPDSDSGGGAQLGVYVHHARGVHNICIYADQDVYAKLSLTCSPDEAVSTRVAAAGGRNPRFEELLTLGVAAAPQSAVLKCEIWMLSRARNLLDDQLLGFALVPLSSAAAAGGSLTQDFPLSSTDLFHSPAGTVRLTLSLAPPSGPPASSSAASTTTANNKNNNSSGSSSSSSNNNSSCSITSEVVILDPADYRRIGIGIELELPDVAAAEQNRQMVAEYFDIMSPSAPFLRLGSSPQPADDYDMIAGSSDGRSNSPGDDGNPSSFASSSSSSTATTATSLSDESKKIAIDSPSNNGSTAEAPPDTPTSKPGTKEGKTESGGSKPAADLGSVFASPMGNINLEAEQAAMQQQIVEMYMKSMQQFTESLAKMKLPMGLDNPRSDDDRGVVIQSRNNTSNSNNNNNNDDDDHNKLDAERKKTKKDGSRVFYGSRAFF